MSELSQEIETLAQVRAALAACRRCPLYKAATQAVAGEGPMSARLMLVGEQPGNDEDLAGKPFVGPAGRVLDRALADAGIERRKVFVTNAVKHFKFERRGKRRLHQRPNASEVEICRQWNVMERAILRPLLTVALGATAARSLLEKSVSISSVRGEVLDTPAGRVVVTIHPSYLLRIRDKDDKAREYRRFVGDLRRCRHMLDRMAA